MLKFLGLRSLQNSLASILVALVALLAITSSAFADKLTMKDGSVLEGTIVREGDNFMIFRVKIGTIEQDRVLDPKDIKKIERDAAAKPADDKDAKTDKPAAEANAPKGKHVKKPGDPTRVAFLNFGLPKATENRPEDMVGIACNVESFRQAMPMLEEAGTDIVVIRIASGGGYTREMPKFNDLFDEYKKKFRTVAWIEYSISAACMSPWVLEEIYFMRNGRMGGCTEFSGNGNASKGQDLEEILAYMEKVSVRGKKDPVIMRSMQIQEPLSCTIDPVTGQVSWFQNLSGEIIVNREGNVLTFDSDMAMKTKFANGLADTREELMKAMGIPEYEFVAENATAYMDANIRENNKTEKEWRDVYQKYARHAQLAAGSQDRKQRGIEIGYARRYLAQLRRMLSVNPIYVDFYGTDDEWFQLQEERLRDLMR